MLGITNAPQGSGGSGGTWTERAENNNWTDLFEIDTSNNNHIKAKKDMVLYSTNNNLKFMVYIPKGFDPNSNTINISCPFTNDGTGSLLKLNAEVAISSNNMTNSYFNALRYTATFSTDGSTVTVSKAPFTEYLYKNAIKVWVKE